MCVNKSSPRIRESGVLHTLTRKIFLLCGNEMFVLLACSRKESVTRILHSDCTNDRNCYSFRNSDCTNDRNYYYFRK